jgi:uncharacterized protein YeaO (DUF488 family)
MVLCIVIVLPFDKPFMHNRRINAKVDLSIVDIKIERIYDNPRGNNNSFRILVDRLWPRGLSKDKVKFDLWQKDIAPSNSLRKWFGHDEKKWDEFKRRYSKELDKNSDLANTIINKAKDGSITLLYGAKEEKFNNAVALKEYLEEKIKE